ncbi:hypothetical protein GCM10010238_29250 [Streptomyces griseoviridis]|uniref:Uncharacterized protein n=1 Tax=Streptomyces griseoviridis TaxID=45398 RepID=A0A918GI05_STRGD|nr:hypothetical protein GCM10010238_29250 [Streptomyces niveoruber]
MRICEVTAGWERPSSAAARVKEPARWTVTNVRNKARSTKTLPLFGPSPGLPAPRYPTNHKNDDRHLSLL